MSPNSLKRAIRKALKLRSDERAASQIKDRLLRLFKPPAKKTYPDSGPLVSVISGPALTNTGYKNVEFVWNADDANGEYLVFANPGIDAKPGWLAPHVDCMNKNPSAGALCMKMLDKKGSIREAGCEISEDGKLTAIGAGDDPALPKYNCVREVECCFDSPLMIRKSLYDEIGGRDKRFIVLPYADTDLCLEVRKRGYKVLYQPKSTVVSPVGFSVFPGDVRKFREKWKDSLPVLDEKKNILVVLPTLPWYDRSAGALRMFHILRFLTEGGWSVTMICRDPKLREQYAGVFEDMGIELYCGDPEAMEASGQYIPGSPKLDYEEILTGRKFDTAILSFWHVADYYLPIVRKHSPETKIIVDTVDIHFLRQLREAEVSGDEALKEQALKDRVREISVYSRADRLWVVTGQDEQTLRELLPGIPQDVIPTIHEKIEAEKAYENTGGLLFVGGFDHKPNVDAAEYLVKEIYPLIEKELPEAKTYIVGNRPPDSIKSLANEKITVTGYVEDLAPYLLDARISVNPIRFGSGMKGKIGEALAWGLPVVTTTMGAEGMSLADGENALIADTAGEFARAIINLYSDRELWERLSKNGKSKAAEWSPEAVKERVFRSLEPDR